MSTATPGTASTIRACTLDELREKKCVVLRGADRPVAVFYNEGEVRAVDNRCPHLGFPLSKGSCEKGMITCHWHHARFDAASGCTFDLFADDVPAFDVEIRGGEVFVSTHPRGGDRKERALRRLREGLEMNIGLISAKSLLALRASGVKDSEIVREVVLFGVRNRDGWSSGLTILTAMANLAPSLSPETSYLALYHGITRVANDCANQVPRRDRQPLDTDELKPERLSEWMEHWTKVRHRDGAERTLRTAVRTEFSPRALGELIFSAASQRFYAQIGHPFDFCNKAFEALDLIGWDHASDVLPTLIGGVVSSRGGEESDSWYHPIDLVALVRNATKALPDAVKRGEAKSWNGEAKLANDLLVDDPAAVINAVMQAIEAGAKPAQLGKALAYAAALRVARFGTANEIGDWFSALHSFTYSNAVHMALKRCPSVELLPAVLHGAVSVYLNRFLNVPPAHLPGAGERDSLDDQPRDAKDLLSGFLDLLDTQQQVTKGAKLIARYVQLNHPIDPLLDTLVQAVVREDADFHTFQMWDPLESTCRHASLSIL